MPKMSQNETPIDKATAVELLRSALSYMQQAGFVILKAEQDNLLWLGFSELTGNLQYNPVVTPIKSHQSGDTKVGLV